MTNPYIAPSADADTASSGHGGVTEAMKEALRGTKGWVKLVGVLFFVGAVFTALGAVAAFAMPAMMGAGKGGMPMGAMAFMALLYVGIALVYVFLGLYLLNYSGAIGRLLVDGQAASMETALQSQQKFWRLAGIIALVMVVISVLGIVAAIAIPMFMRR
jgi:hypothetical protein